MVKHQIQAAAAVGRAPTSLADRYLIMGLAGKLHWTNSKLLKTIRWVGCTAIRLWAARGRQGRDSAEDEPRSGRPTALPAPARLRLQKALQNKRFVTPAKLAGSFGVHPQTIRRTARDLGLVPVKLQHRCRQSEKQRVYRVEWAETRKAKTAASWRTWVFSDEKWFYLVCRKSGEWVWVAQDDHLNEARYIPRDKNPTKVMVWAAISYDGRSSLHVFPAKTKVDSHEYQYCMQEALLPAIQDKEYLFPGGTPRKWVYQQDGAPCHTSNSTFAWLEKHLPKGCSINDGGKWPAGSPDLNPIENLWNFFQNKVVEFQPSSFDQFKELLVDVWWDISQDYIRTLYNSMPRRIEAVLNSNGKMTKY